MQVDPLDEGLGAGHEPETHPGAQDFGKGVEPQNPAFRVQGKEARWSPGSELESINRM